MRSRSHLLNLLLLLTAQVAGGEQGEGGEARTAARSAKAGLFDQIEDFELRGEYLNNEI